MTFDANWLQDVPHTPQDSGENCNPAPKERINGAIVPFKREIPVQDDDILARAQQALGILKTPAEALQLLKATFNAFSSDPAATAELVRGAAIMLREIAPHGRPSGASPPPWSEHKKDYLSDGKNAADFVIDHYSSQFGRGFSKATLRTDPLLYRDVLNLLRHHPMPAELKPYFISKKELNDNRLAEIGGRITAATVPDLGERTRLHSVTYARTRRAKPQNGLSFDP